MSAVPAIMFSRTGAGSHPKDKRIVGRATRLAREPRIGLPIQRGRHILTRRACEECQLLPCACRGLVAMFDVGYFPPNTPPGE
jgi:hypothetical protein